MLDDLTMGTIVSGSVLGLIGFIMFLYGKRESQPLTAIVGLVLSVLPMVMHEMLPLWLVSVGLVGVVILHRRHTDTSPIA